MMAERPALVVRNLEVSFLTVDGEVQAVRDVSFEVGRGEIVGLVGESGSGKSATALAIMGLLPAVSSRVRGSAMVSGVDMLALSPRQLARVRGRDMGMIFQEPMSALDPLFRIGDQIAETVRAHQRVSRRAAAARAVEILGEVGIPDAASRSRAYPHQLSGGMRQRAMIAMALACRPALLIADEPTTALDVTIQAQILALMVDLQQRLGTGLILITHDLGVVAQTAQRVIVMYAGKKVEEATVESLFETPLHPYTRGLMASIPAVPSPDAKADVRLVEIPGMVPSLTKLPPGCAFAPRCKLAVERCRQEYPPLDEVKRNHWAACWRAGEMAEAS